MFHHFARFARMNGIWQTLRALTGHRMRRFVLLCTLLTAAGIGPTLAGNIVLPWIAQKTASECGRAVLATLAARSGGDIERLYSRLPTPPDQVRGYSVLEMQQFGRRVGVDLSVVAPRGLVIAGDCSPRPAVKAHFARLTRFLSSGHPVVVPVTIGAGRGHYLVLTGTDRGDFWALDPALFPGLRLIEPSELAARMCEYGYVALVAR